MAVLFAQRTLKAIEAAEPVPWPSLTDGIPGLWLWHAVAFEELSRLLRGRNLANLHRDAPLGVVKVEDRVRLLLRGPVFDRVPRGDRVSRRGALTARAPRCIRDDEVEVTGGSAHRVPTSVADLPTLAQDFPRNLPVCHHAYLLLLAYLRVRAGPVIPWYGDRTSLYPKETVLFVREI